MLRLDTFKERAGQVGRRLVERLQSSKLSARVESARDWSSARFRLMGRVGLWYHSDYDGESASLSARVPHLELDRGRRIVDFLEREGLVFERDVRKGAPIPMDALTAFHDLSYLEKVTWPDKLARIFGLHGRDVDVDLFLRAQRRAAGGTLQAACWAVERSGRRAFNLGGGFHHAEPEAGAGFCVYNDIGASIRRLRRDGFTGRIAIVDLDFHQGNGNSVAFAEDPTVFTYSLHGAIWDQVESESNLDVHVPAGTGDEDYLSCLRESLEPRLRAFGPELVFYLAGTDILESDALGDFAVSAEGAFERDRWVLSLCGELEASVVVTLAGGYSRDAWCSSARMIRWALTDEEGEVQPPRDDDIRERFGGIASRLDPYQLQFGPGPLELTEEDLLADLDARPRANLLLDYYSKHGVELAFERYGFLEALRWRGFRDVRLDVDPSDRDRQRIAIYGSKDGKSYHLLMELLVARRRIPAPEGLEEPLEALDMLSIEWLLLQDPTREFTLDHPRLPGQAHPGLGLSRELMEMLYQVCLRLGLDGIVVHPSRFHISAFAQGEFFFIEPELQGHFDAMKKKLGTLDVAKASSLIEEGQLQDRRGVPIEWQAEDFATPVSERLRRYFSSEPYQTRRRRAFQELLDLGLRSAAASSASSAPGSVT